MTALVFSIGRMKLTSWVDMSESEKIESMVRDAHRREGQFIGFIRVKATKVVVRNESEKDGVWARSLTQRL